MAQIRGRNNLSWEKRFTSDLEYVNSIKFLIDLKIIIKTIINVGKKEGTNLLTEKTQTFNGN